MQSLIIYFLVLIVLEKNKQIHSVNCPLRVTTVLGFATSIKWI